MILVMIIKLPLILSGKHPINSIEPFMAASSTLITCSYCPSEIPSLNTTIVAGRTPWFFSLKVVNSLTNISSRDVIISCLDFCEDITHAYVVAELLTEPTIAIIISNNYFIIVIFRVSTCYTFTFSVAFVRVRNIDSHDHARLIKQPRYRSWNRLPSIRLNWRWW